MKILSLATCFNRKEKTVNAIQTLLNQEVGAGTSLEICIVDDGSTDGTAREVSELFPSVKVLEGTGSLFWSGGMRFGWEHYVKNKSFDFLLVFNDDIELYPHALGDLLKSACSPEDKCVVTGAFESCDKKTITYSAVIRDSSWHPLRFRRISPTESVQIGDTLNMNFALISKGAIEAIGFLSDSFQHSRADFDYGLRLKRAGGAVLLAPRAIGQCERNPAQGSSRDQSIPLLKRWNKLLSLKEQEPVDRARFYRRHCGILWPFFWAAPYVRFWVMSVFEKIPTTRKVKN